MCVFEICASDKVLERKHHSLMFNQYFKSCCVANMIRSVEQLTKPCWAAGYYSDRKNKNIYHPII